MKLHSDLTINGTLHKKGSHIAWYAVYPFFFIHMFMFGVSGFVMAYSSDVDITFLYMHGGIAITVYLVFYFAIFGVDEVKWMFINAALGLWGMYVEIDTLLGMFGKSAAAFPLHVHLIPFLYYTLYTFLWRQALIDICQARENPERRRKVEMGFVIGFILLYIVL